MRYYKYNKEKLPFLIKLVSIQKLGQSKVWINYLTL